MSDTITALPAGLATLEQRTEIIKALIDDNFGRKVISVAPLGRDSNNFVHLVDLAEAIGRSDTNTSASQPATHELDLSVVRVVVRLSNPNSMIDEEVRVENEVAAISLIRRALISYPRNIVPKVFAWKGSKHSLGWIVQEYLAGKQLSLHFSDLSTDKKAVVLDQVAEIFKMIQSSKHDVKGFGGLRFISPAPNDGSYVYIKIQEGIESELFFHWECHHHKLSLDNMNIPKNTLPFDR